MCTAAGDGGAIVTSDDALDEQIRQNRELGQCGQNNHVTVGYHSKLDAIQCIVLGAKRPLLDEWNRMRQSVAKRYRDGLGEAPVYFQRWDSGEEHVFHLFQIGCDRRDELLDSLQAAGIDAAIIGALWAEGVIAEIILFIYSGKLVQRTGPVAFLVLAAGAGIIRWSVLGATTDLAALVAVQGFHAFTFGAAHVAAMHFIAREIPAEFTATAQSLYSSFAVGTTMALALLAAGWLSCCWPAAPCGQPRVAYPASRHPGMTHHRRRRTTSSSSGGGGTWTARTTPAWHWASPATVRRL